MPEFEKQQNPNQSGYLARSAVRGRSMPKPAHDDNPLLAQQQALGNQAMQRFAESCPLTLPSASICPFGGVCHTCPVQVQTKLKINQPGDKYEQEADQVAEEVMRMSDLNVSASSQSEGVPPAEHIQRLCPECEDELQRQPEEEEEEELLQAKEIPGQTTEINSSIETKINSVQSGGRPLPESARNYFEPRFGYDFSQVRVHTDAGAAKSAQTVNAQAYTLGRDIIFGNGNYSPETTPGRHLLAHELTHVVQQSTLNSRKVNFGIENNSQVEPLFIQRLGANPGCSAGERSVVHQAIFNARGWLNKAIKQMETTPLPAKVIRSLRRNFGPTYGVTANISLIVGRLRRGYREISNIPIGCVGTGNATCAANHCGFAIAGGHAVTICRNVTLTAGRAWQFQAGCVLHESFHAAFSNFTVDEYSGWHGFSGSTLTYPGAGTDPLLNADSYTSLVMDLS